MSERIKELEPPVPKQKGNYTMVRIKRTTKKIAEKKAAQQRRSVANYVDNLILNDKE